MGSVSGVDDLSTDSWPGHLEVEEQQLPGAGNRGPGAPSLNVPANMQPTVRFGSGGASSDDGPSFTGRLHKSSSGVHRTRSL